ncbi:MAG: hypothetical protein ACTSVI_12330 [Promethearchaeota archaeon]
MTRVDACDVNVDDKGLLMILTGMNAPWNIFSRNVITAAFKEWMIINALHCSLNALINEVGMNGEKSFILSIFI